MKSSLNHRHPWHCPQLEDLEARCRTFSGTSAALDESSQFITGDCVGGPVNK